jgi:hypothetical protein
MILFAVLLALTAWVFHSHCAICSVIRDAPAYALAPILLIGVAFVGILIIDSWALRARIAALVEQGRDRDVFYAPK